MTAPTPEATQFEESPSYVPTASQSEATGHWFLDEHQKEEALNIGRSLIGESEQRVIELLGRTDDYGPLMIGLTGKVAQSASYGFLVIYYVDRIVDRVQWNDRRWIDG